MLSFSACFPWKSSFILQNPISVQVSCSIISNSLRPHELQHTRISCPSPTLRACSNSCPSSCWCHPTISSSVIPFSSCLQSFPASGSFPMNLLFESCGQSIGSSASASVLPMNIQDWFPLGLTGLMSLLSKGLSRVFSSTTIWMHQLFGGQFSFYFFLTVSMKRQKNRSIRNHLFSCLGWFGIEFACPANPLLSWKIILWAEYAPNSGKLRFSFCDFAGMSKTQINIMWKWKSLSQVRLCATPWTIQSMEFSRPEYWSG